ncbi:MAG: hypothetical protein M3O29_02230, partial [Actinomycetota bacterium]|nr:hypothetical protein [Actinomycetota bacterium]
RVLEQDLRPDVIVLDGDVTATAVLVARELSPSSRVIVIWPDGVQLPSAAERVPPRLVYEQLGPTIRRAAGERQLPEPILPAEESDPGLRRAASRVSVTTVMLVAAIVLTMGASFALDGWNAPNAAAPSRSTAPRSTAVRTSPTAAPATAQQQGDVRGSKPEPCASAARSDRKVPNADPTCRHPIGPPVNGSAHPSGMDHGNAKDGAGNSGAHGNGGGAANGQSDAHGRPEEIPSSTAATGHGPKS